jgi:nucleotide-binding universal stress UspA family protein
MYELESGHFNFGTLRKRVFASSRKHLADLESRRSSQGIKVKIASLEANRADTITDYALKNGMELIIMATHGYPGFKKLMLGNGASGILNQSSVPVLLIRPEACRL